MAFQWPCPCLHQCQQHFLHSGNLVGVFCLLLIFIKCIPLNYTAHVHVLSNAGLGLWPTPMALSMRLWLETQRYWARILAESDFCNRGCSFQSSKLFKGLDCAVPSMILCTIKTLKLFKKSREWSRLRASFLLSRYCNDFAESNVKHMSLKPESALNGGHFVFCLYFASWPNFNPALA